MNSKSQSGTRLSAFDQEIRPAGPYAQSGRAVLGPWPPNNFHTDSPTDAKGQYTLYRPFQKATNFPRPLLHAVRSMVENFRQSFATEKTAHSFNGPVSVRLGTEVWHGCKDLLMVESSGVFHPVRSRDLPKTLAGERCRTTQDGLGYAIACIDNKAQEQEVTISYCC
ncbi:hypothetical protein BS50DRAFT_123701 [Corynespora cassiicola Philippines]|uniref:Uncharacterized protein n=1 Tax=Corynespora cassiicola Philippines TaxID=1448308 RepID=A0A2T2NBI2_CORCC|nr:hypothetical protein BS50DRAFT_123701 [Corynespora cassiicola Philippines]